MRESLGGMVMQLFVHFARLADRKTLIVLPQYRNGMTENFIERTIEDRQRGKDHGKRNDVIELA